MKKIGIISDTHSYLGDEVMKFLAECDIVFHAGDIGSWSLVESLRERFELIAVYGNIDGGDCRLEFKEYVSVEIEGVKFLMTHIGGYPRSYMPKAEKKIREEKPKIFISGHSHILKVMNDKDYNLLHINPGAAGRYGFHRVRTAIRFIVDNGDIRELEVGEWSR